MTLEPAGYYSSAELPGVGLGFVRCGQGAKGIAELSIVAFNYVNVYWRYCLLGEGIEANLTDADRLDHHQGFRAPVRRV